MTKIQILTTGGTIEGLEYDKPNQAPEESPMPLEKLLYLIENLPEHHIKRVLLKDSRFIEDRDRALIVSEIKKCNSKAKLTPLRVFL